MKERRPGKAMRLFERALKIQKAKLGRDDLRIVVTREEMVRCVGMRLRGGKDLRSMEQRLDAEEARKKSGVY